MNRPGREEFILDVRRSAKTLQQPNVVADSDTVNTDAISKLLSRAALWLTPSVVEHYHPDDFRTFASEAQQELERAVREFRGIAAQVPPDKAATVDQFTEGVGRFRHLINVLGGMVLAEWMRAIECLEVQAEGWSDDAGWRTRRVKKKITESLVGTYDATQLLIYAEPHLYVLDPVARFVPAAQGAFDFAIQPSYCVTSIYRNDSGVWYVHLDVGRGVSKGRREEWNKGSFHECIAGLRVLV